MLIHAQQPGDSPFFITGLLGLAVAMATGEAYRKLALENQRNAFVELAKLEVNNQLDNLIQDGIQLGLDIQTSPEFKKAIQSHDETQITTLLNKYFHHKLVTLNKITLHKLYVIDPEFHLLASSEEGNKDFPRNKLVCTNLLNKPLQLHSATRLRPNSDLCFIEEDPALAIIVAYWHIKDTGLSLNAIRPNLKSHSHRGWPGDTLAHIHTK